MTNDQHTDANLVSLLRFVIKHIRTLALVGIVAAVVSAIVSLVMTEYFTSTAVIFPARINSVTLNDYGVRRGNISDFGEEEEAEQLLQIINSDNLIERVVDRHNLYDHYKISRKDPHSRTTLYKTYAEYVSAKRTKFNSVEIKVVDKVPEMAADIANTILELIDNVKNGMISERASASVGIVDEVYTDSQGELARIESRMDSLHGMGVATEQERAALYRAYGDALSNSKGNAAAQLRAQLEVNKKYGDEYDLLKRQRDLVSDESLRLRFFREQFLADADVSISQKFVVDRAVPSDKKSKPIRWLIVVGSVAAACLFTLMMLLFRERWPDLMA